MWIICGTKTQNFKAILLHCNLNFKGLKSCKRGNEWKVTSKNWWSFPSSVFVLSDSDIGKSLLCIGTKKYGHKSGCPLQGSTDHWKCQIWILMQSPFSASGEVGRVCAMTILDLAVKASEKMEVKVGRVSFSLCFVKKCPNWSSCWTKKSERLKVRGENFFPCTFVFRLISSFYRS